MQPVDLACPVALPSSPVTVEVAVTGLLDSDWKQVVDSGKTGPVDLPLLVGILRHPDGIVTVDAGMGQTTRDGTFPKWPLSTFPVDVPAGASLAERLGAPPAPPGGHRPPGPPLRVLMTHLHYDHIGGLFDLAGTEVWTAAADAAAYFPGNVHFPVSLRTIVNWHVVGFAPGEADRVMGRPAVDVMGDGTIWYLSTPGHTPGAASVLVLAADHPWLFVGDTAWVDDHLTTARRPFASSLLVDAQPRLLNASLEWSRWLAGNCHDLTVVAGHEPRWIGP